MLISSINSNDVMFWHESLVDLAFKACPLQTISLCSNRSLLLLAASIAQTCLLF